VVVVLVVVVQQLQVEQVVRPPVHQQVVVQVAH
jgi:hypothetical protein